MIIFTTEQYSTDLQEPSRLASKRSLDKRSHRALWGLGAAVLAGVGWGSYFIPIQAAGTSPWVAALPLAVGMLAGSALPLYIRRRNLVTNVRSARLSLFAGGIWAIGNYGSLQMMEVLGTGRGFAVAQACVVVNALVGIYIFHTPKPGASAARQTLTGIAIATLGALAIGLTR